MRARWLAKRFGSSRAAAHIIIIGSSALGLVSSRPRHGGCRSVGVKSDVAAVVYEKIAGSSRLIYIFTIDALCV